MPGFPHCLLTKSVYGFLGSIYYVNPAMLNETDWIFESHQTSTTRVQHISFASMGFASSNNAFQDYRWQVQRKSMLYGNQVAQENPKVHVIGSNIMLFCGIHVGKFVQIFFDIFVHRHGRLDFMFSLVESFIQPTKFQNEGNHGKCEANTAQSELFFCSHRPNARTRHCLKSSRHKSLICKNCHGFTKWTIIHYPAMAIELQTAMRSQMWIYSTVPNKRLVAHTKKQSKTENHG